MSENNGTGKPDLNELRADIKLTRAELGETVQALAAKADVKARAKEQVEQTKQKVKAQVAEVTGRARDAAVHAGGQVRSATESAVDGTGSAIDATERRSPVPLPLIIAGVAALVGIILVVRGRRR